MASADKIKRTPEEKAADKAEAARRGMSYKEFKHQRKRELAALETSEHRAETKRMRAWSGEFESADDAKRRRTRAGDAAEEERLHDAVSAEEWRKEHGITVQGHGSRRGNTFADPYRKFTEAPFHERIQHA